MKWLALAFALFASSAHANEIDYFCIFSSAATAQADGAVGVFWNGSAWDTSTTFPGVSVATPAALINGISPITGFWIVVSQTVRNAALDADTNCVMTLDRDQGKINGNFVVAASVTGTNRTSLSFKPQPMAVSGSAYPSPLGK